MVCYKTMISIFIMKFVLSFLLVLFKSSFSKLSVKLFALWFDLDSRLWFFHFSPMLIRGSIPRLPPPSLNYLHYYNSKLLNTILNE